MVRSNLWEAAVSSTRGGTVPGLLASSSLLGCVVKNARLVIDGVEVFVADVSTEGGKYIIICEASTEGRGE